MRDSNSRHLVLETSALPTELHPYLYFGFLIYDLRLSGKPVTVNRKNILQDSDSDRYKFADRNHKSDIN